MIDLIKTITLEHLDEDTTKHEEVNETLHLFISYNFKTLIRNFSLFDEDSTSLPSTLQIAEYIEGKIIQDSSSYFLLGLSCLHTFVADNWTHGTGLTVSYLFPWLSSDTRVEKDLLEKLVGDGDSVSDAITLMPVLALAKIILVDNWQKYSSIECNLWSIRCGLIVQQILDEKSTEIYNTTKNIFDHVKKHEVSKNLKPLFLLEEAKFYYIYYYIRECGEITEAAATAVGLKIVDTGALGKRTRFQQEHHPQFTINLEENSAHYSKRVESIKTAYLPQDLQLNDEVRLESIDFLDKEREQVRDLDSLQQCVLLSRYFLKERNLPVDDISWQELTPHLSIILQHPVSWSIHTTALFHRCKLESKSRRSVERARAQLETILESYLDRSVPMSVRMKDIFTSRLPPKWIIQRELGNILLSLGAVKSALDVFEKIECWDEVIVCYNLLQMRHKSAEIIKKRLAVKETPRLLCQLGDATDDLECYHKALHISNNKSARAYKSLGLHSYYRKDYINSISYFKKSLDCSRFQLDVLLKLGFAAMEICEWSVGAQAYRDYCSLESDNFEAWNNLSNCYIKLGDKERAWRVLQESIRCEYDNWKVWVNMMLVSTDLGAFDESIRCYNRILDIKHTYMDEQVLLILAHSVITGVEDSSGEKSVKYRPQLVKLLARLTVAMPKEPVPWSAYGRLLLASTNQNEPENEVKGCQCLQKSLASYTSKRGWDKDTDSAKSVLEAVRLLVQGVLSVQSKVQQLQLANSARLNVVSSLKMVERSQTNISTGTIQDSIQQLYLDAQTDVNYLLERIEEIKAAEG